MARKPKDCFDFTNVDPVRPVHTTLDDADDFDLDDYADEDDLPQRIADALENE